MLTRKRRCSNGWSWHLLVVQSCHLCMKMCKYRWDLPWYLKILIAETFFPPRPKYWNQGLWFPFGSVYSLFNCRLCRKEPHFLHVRSLSVPWIPSGYQLIWTTLSFQFVWGNTTSFRRPKCRTMERRWLQKEYKPNLSAAIPSCFWRKFQWTSFLVLIQWIPASDQE